MRNQNYLIAAGLILLGIAVGHFITSGTIVQYPSLQFLFIGSIFGIVFFFGFEAQKRTKIISRVSISLGIVLGAFTSSSDAGFIMFLVLPTAYLSFSILEFLTRPLRNKSLSS